MHRKATHPGLLKVSGLQEGVYTFKMTVTDTAGQKSSDDVSVTVLAPKHQAEGERLASIFGFVVVSSFTEWFLKFVCVWYSTTLSQDVQCVIFLYQQYARVTVQTISSSVMTAAVSTSCTPVMGSNTARTALTKTSAPTVRNHGFPQWFVLS